MKEILYIAYEFPPLNRGGTYRAMGFVKYLKQFGIKPIVLTLAEKSYANVFKNYQIDRELKNEIPIDIPIYEIESEDVLKKQKIKTIDYLNRFFKIITPEAKYWENKFLSAVSDIIKTHNPKAIFVTVPPFSMLFLAMKISKKYRLPLITDMRDAWSQWITVPYKSFFHYYFTLRGERQVVSYSSAVILTSEQTKNDLLRLHPKVNKAKITTITNGFDKEIANWVISNISSQNERITIGYVGSFYYSPRKRKQMLSPWWKKKINRMIQYTPRKEDWLYRSPYFFLKTLKLLFKYYPEYKKKVCFRFAGHKPYWFDDMLLNLNMNSNVEYLGVLSHDKSIEFQKSCDALLITSSKVLNGRDYSIAGKTFEYLTIKKPIIAFVCDGAQKDLLEKTGMACICNPDDIIDSKNRLNLLIKGNVKLKTNINFVSKFHRKKLTKQLADIIKGI